MVYEIIAMIDGIGQLPLFKIWMGNLSCTCRLYHRERTQCPFSMVICHRYNVCPMKSLLWKAGKAVFPHWYFTSMWVPPCGLLHHADLNSVIPQNQMVYWHHITSCRKNNADSIHKTYKKDTWPYLSNLSNLSEIIELYYACISCTTGPQDHSTNFIGQ